VVNRFPDLAEGASCLLPLNRRGAHRAPGPGRPRSAQRTPSSGLPACGQHVGRHPVRRRPGGYGRHESPMMAPTSEPLVVGRVRVAQLGELALSSTTVTMARDAARL